MFISDALMESVVAAGAALYKVVDTAGERKYLPLSEQFELIKLVQNDAPSMFAGGPLS